MPSKVESDAPTRQQPNNDDKENNNNVSNDAALQKWREWVPMEKELYSTLQLAQLCTLQKVDEMLADIPYWLCGGTLMGALRHGGFIPHDDDIDLECFQEDLSRIAAIPLDPPLYTGFVQHSGTWEGHSVAKLEFLEGLLEIDIFPRPSPLPAGMRHFPSQEEAFPRSRFRFHNIEVWGPNPDKCATYLDRCYDKDWRDTVCVYNHDYNWWHSSGFDPRKEVWSLQDYNAIVAGAEIQPPQAQASSKATFQQLEEQDLDGFIEKYKSYRFQRTIRRNRTEAEYRERRGTQLGCE